LVLSYSLFIFFFFLLIILPPPTSTLFPYTTLFRSSNSQVIRSGDAVDQADVDRTRNLIYSVIQEHSLIYDQTPCRIDLYVSKDGGTSWTLIGPVNRVLSTQAFNQGIAVLNDGRIAISYYDFRNHQ